MSVLERCLYQRDVCIREMSVLETRDMSVLERDVCIRKMSALEAFVLERSLY